MRILIVEDEDALRKLVKLNLEMEGYEVVGVASGKDALQRIDGEHYHLIILDVMLPEIDGFELCEKIRLANNEVPILFLTAKDAAEDRIQGLKKGGDDYLTKPFVLEELLLRIKNLLKRTARAEEAELKEYAFGDNKVNFTTYKAETEQGVISLTQKEVMLLKMLINRRNEVVSRKQILQYVWGYDVFPSTRTIDNFILNFRKYFEKDPKKPVFFESVRGVGYKFSEEGRGKKEE